MSKKMQHYIRFGSHNETKILTDRDLKNRIHHLTFNSNVVVHSPVAICKLLNFKINGNISYFIDPQTYILQLSAKKYLLRKNEKTKNYVLKTSIKKLLSEYGIDSEKFLDSHFQEEIGKDIKSLATNVIKFQQNFLENINKSLEKSDGYSDFQEDNKKKIKPEFIVIPYFYLQTDQFSKWLDLNISAINTSILEFPDIDNFACQLVVPKEVIFGEKSGYKKLIIDHYSKIETNTILIWIDDLDETELSRKNIEDLVLFVKDISNHGKKRVINLYGGFLSYILTLMGVWQGFCNGPGYGESRSVIPVGGGIPTAKYYLPKFYNRVNTEALVPQLLALNWIEDYFLNICNCRFCKKTFQTTNVSIPRFMEIFGRYKENLSSNNRQIPESKTLLSSQLHYLHRRIQLIENFHKDTIEKVYDEIKNTLIEVDDCESYIPNADHLYVWKDFLDANLPGDTDE